MASLEEIRDGRIQKLEGLRALGIDAYPVDSKQDYTLSEVLAQFTKLSKLKKKSIHLVGRVFSIRGQGALAFVDFSDGTDTFQAVLKKDETLDEEFSRFRSFVDIGDFVEFEGTLFTTQTKQKSLLVRKWKMLAKSLRPLPEKWHGLQDVEERFRRRYLDVLMSPEVKERFIIRSRVITEMRRILDESGYLEVETPALQPIAGGASAKPFVTHHNALDIDMYLRISPELYLKRMLVSGLPKVYEIARDFRNEGIDATHNPEFTMVEYYEAYSTAEKQMVFTEKLLKTIVKNVFKTNKISFDGHDIDFSKSFTVVSYLDLLRTYALISDPETITIEELTLKASQLGVKTEKGDTISKILDNIYKKTCRPKIIQPTFIIDYPAEYLPLAKRHPKNKALVDAFQLVIGSIELVKAFSELNDPIDQKDRLVKESDKQKGGDDEAQNDDQDFIEAMEYGMPPAGGVGIGIDRLVMFLTDTHNIKEVIFFPTMRPRE